MPKAGRTVIGVRSGVNNSQGGVENRGKRRSENYVITCGNGVRVLNRCVEDGRIIVYLKTPLCPSF